MKHENKVNIARLFNAMAFCNGKYKQTFKD